ncbi:MAG: uroporphyrinogen decarboxylase family protein [Oscillospiraceae bacterium]|nr:uroporphyrinogen decarboxylase family protein [Oscillospiraceae bacterium]MDD4413512.1 uroporphyrinogen decarboxylase family protein [Oscillospiraceae bacterium]
MNKLSEKQRFIKALKREKLVGRVPHFELVFYLTMESIGKVHPLHRSYYQWNQMSDVEKTAQIKDVAECYTEIARKYHHSAIFVHANPGDFENTVRLLREIREQTGNEYFLMMHGDPTFPIPDGDNMMEFSCMLFDEKSKAKEMAQKRVEDSIRWAENMAKQPDLLDGFALCSDYCFNTNPFFSPSMFEEFISPYLLRIISEYRSMGFYSIKHSDGNIVPIVDQILECKPDALHSLDPQGGVDLGYMKKHYGSKVAMIGNVNCGLLQTGTTEQCVEDIRRSLREGMDGYGYIFSTSNCVYKGMPLERYELMNSIWQQEGIYPDEKT